MCRQINVPNLVARGDGELVYFYMLMETKYCSEYILSVFVLIDLIN